MRLSGTRRFMVIVSIAAVAAGIIAVGVANASTTPPPSGTSSESPIQPYPATEYWTPERMKNAQPAPMPGG